MEVATAVSAGNAGVWVTLVAPALVGAITGIAVGITTTILALKRYYRERWWDRRFEVYFELVDALHDMKQLPQEAADAVVVGRTIAPEIRRPLQEKYGIALDLIRKHRSKGELLFPDRALQVLDSLLSYLKDDRTDVLSELDYWEGLDIEITDCIEKIVPIARDDLSLAT